MNENKIIEELFKAGAHLGHKAKRIHPKAKKYIYSFDNGTSVIDLTKTAELLKIAKEFITTLSKNNKTLVIVMTKKINVPELKELFASKGINYITTKWPAGLLTNFDMIIKNVKKMLKMREEKDKGEWDKFVKHERIKLDKKLKKLEKFYGGISGLTKLPDALFVVDVKKEKNAVKEAKETKIPVVAVADTNVNPDTVDYPIPGNDDSASSIEYFVKEIVNAYAKTVKS